MSIRNNYITKKSADAQKQGVAGRKTWINDERFTIIGICVENANKLMGICARNVEKRMGI